MSDGVDSELALSEESTRVDAKSTPPHSTPLQREFAARQRNIGPGRPDNSRIKVLLVDGDLTARGLVANYLEDYSMCVTVVSGSQEARRQFAAADQSLVILNVDSANGGDIELLRAIRSRSDVPVIVTVGPNRSENERSVRLELGADDCITKPVGLRELLAKIRAILRRRKRRLSAPPKDPERSCYRFGGWQLDRQTRCLTNPGGESVPLTRGEYALLIAFLDAPQRPLTREYLLQATRMHEDCLDFAINLRIARLRRKLEADHRAPRIIRTERGVS